MMISSMPFVKAARGPIQQSVLEYSRRAIQNFERHHCRTSAESFNVHHPEWSGTPEFPGQYNVFPSQTGEEVTVQTPKITTTIRRSVSCKPFGGLPERSTRDATPLVDEIFNETAKAVYCKPRACRRPQLVVQVLFDLSKAFDMVSREDVWETLARTGISHSFLLFPGPSMQIRTALKRIETTRISKGPSTGS